MARPRKFDEQDVVDRAMELFWTKGYEATSVSDLTEQLGVHPGTLYRTFGDKYQLFLRALTHYQDSSARNLAPTLLTGGPVLPRIRAVLIGYIDMAAKEENPRGCLLANSAGEFLPADKNVAARLCQILSIVEDGFLQGLRAAARQGEISSTLDLPAIATAVTMLLEGLQVIVKTDSDPRRLVTAVDTALLALVRLPAYPTAFQHVSPPVAVPQPSTAGNPA